MIPTMRLHDSWGSGEFGAPRGSRTHNGVDLSVPPGAPVFSVTEGEVTKIGYPYPPADTKRGKFRYVEITNEDGLRFRYFYVVPSVQIGQKILSGEEIGEADDISEAYPGMIPHVHFEIKLEGKYLNPHDFLS